MEIKHDATPIRPAAVVMRPILYQFKNNNNQDSDTHTHTHRYSVDEDTAASVVSLQEQCAGQIPISGAVEVTWLTAALRDSNHQQLNIAHIMTPQSKKK